MGRYVHGLNDYQTRTLDPLAYPGQGTPRGLMFAMTRLSGSTSAVADVLANAMEFDNFRLQHGDEMTPSRKSVLIDKLGEVLWALARASDELGVTLETVANRNVSKVELRAQWSRADGEAKVD